MGALLICANLPVADNPFLLCANPVAIDRSVLRYPVIGYRVRVCPNPIADDPVLICANAIASDTFLVCANHPVASDLVHSVRTLWPVSRSGVCKSPCCGRSRVGVSQ